jgi:hypothetical protein
MKYYRMHLQTHRQDSSSSMPCLSSWKQRMPLRLPRRNCRHLVQNNVALATAQDASIQLTAAQIQVRNRSIHPHSAGKRYKARRPKYVTCSDNSDITHFICKIAQRHARDKSRVLIFAFNSSIPANAIMPASPSSLSGMFAWQARVTTITHACHGSRDMPKTSMAEFFFSASASDIAPASPREFPTKMCQSHSSNNYHRTTARTTHTPCSKQ